MDRVYSCYMETEFSFFPRMAALAENVWSPAEKSLQDIYGSGSLHSKEQDSGCINYRMTDNTSVIILIQPLSLLQAIYASAYSEAVISRRSSGFPHGVSYR